MHELSIAVNIVMAAQQESEARGVEVGAVYLRLGALTGVEVSSLLFSYEIASQGTPLQGSRLIIEEVPLTIYCSSCQTEFELEGIQSIRCPECHQLSGEIQRGREIEIVALEVKD